jgi:Transglutaminase-like superfamily
MTRRLDRSTLRAAWWAWRSLHRARRRLRRQGLNEFRLEPPPELPAAAGRGVHAVLRRFPQTCLERAMVLQEWHAAHGESREVVIAVGRPEGSFRAHAWLEGESDGAADLDEVMRVPAR